MYLNVNYGYVNNNDLPIICKWQLMANKIACSNIPSSLKLLIVGIGVVVDGDGDVYDDVGVDIENKNTNLYLLTHFENSSIYRVCKIFSKFSLRSPLLSPNTLIRFLWKRVWEPSCDTQLIVFPI